MAGRRIGSIEQLRGVAAMGVVVCHAVGQFYGITRYSHGPIRLLGWSGQIGVALFFVISGFCIRLPLARARAEDTGARLDVKPYLAHRALRILPPYWLAVVASILVGMIAPIGLLDGDHRPLDIAMHALALHSLLPSTFTHINGVFWTISLEVQFYVAYLLFANRRAGWRTGLALVILSIAVYGAASLAFPVPNPWRQIGQEILFATFWQWYLGAILADAFVRWAPKPPSGLPGAALVWAARIAAIGACLLLGMGDPVLLQVHLTYWALPFAATALVASFLAPARPWAPPGLLSRTLSALGRISYSLYLFHPVVLGLVVLGLHKALLPAGGGVALTLAGSVLVAWISYRLIERPLLRLKARQPPTVEADSAPWSAAAE